MFGPSLQLPLPVALHVINPHADTEQFTKPLYFSWPGTSCENGRVAIPGPVASALGLPLGTQVTVTPLAHVPTATSVTIEPSSPDDWEIVQLNADRLEETLLSQLAVASKGQHMFMWVNNQLIRFDVEATKPPAPVVKLVQGTELAIAPRTRANVNGSSQSGQSPNPTGKEETAKVSAALRIQPLDDAHEPTDSSRGDTSSLVKPGHGGAMYSHMVHLSPRTASSLGLQEGQWVKLQSNKQTSLFGKVAVAEDCKKSVCADNHAGLRLMTSLALGLQPFDTLQLQSLTSIEIEALKERQSRQGGAGDDGVRVDEVYRLSQIRSELATATESMTRIQRTAAERILEALLPVLAFAPRDILRSWKAPRQGSVVLEGPQGSGKSWLTKTLTRMLSTHPGCLTAVNIVPCHKLSSEPEARQCIRSAVSSAFARAPALIVLDDLDVICPAAMPIGHGEDGQHHGAGGDMVPMDHGGFTAWLCDILDELVTPVDRNGWTDTPVAILATCREATGLATPLREVGRFDSVASLSVATSAGHRSDMIRASAMSRGVSVDPITTDTIAPKADCFDFGDIGVLLDRAVAVATRRYVINSDASLTNGLHLIESDFDEALEGMVPSALWGSLESNAVGAGLRGWQDVGGLTTVCEALREAIELPLLYPKLVDSAPLRLRTGILLYGPPGCGKTHVVSAAVAAIGVRCITVSGPEVLNKYIGASEAAIRDIFKKAAGAAPCVLFFDEFDAIAPRRGHDNTGVTDRVVNQMLTELDGVEGQLKGVTVVAATSRPDLIDQALLRPGRLDRLLLCDFPHSIEERVDILKSLSRALVLEDGVDLREVALGADGFSGADLGSVLSEAQLMAAHDALRDLTNLLNKSNGKNDNSSSESDVVSNSSFTYSSQSGEQQKPATVVVRQKHLLEALSSARPSVSSTERRRLARIYQGMQGGVDSFDSVVDTAGGDFADGIPRKKVTLA